MVFTDEQLKDMFTYHRPSVEQQGRYMQLREAAHHLAEIINNLCPMSADTSAAIRHVREAVMTANASIALEK